MFSMNSVSHSIFHRKAGCRRASLLLSVLLLSAALLSGCGTDKEAAKTRTAVYFDTVISVTLYGADTDALFDTCFSVADRCEALFDPSLPDSDIARINSHPFEAVTVDPMTAELLSRALYWCEQSGGLFDITIGRLTDLWNIPQQAAGEAPPVLPDPDTVAQAAEEVDYTCVDVRGQTVTLHSDACAIDVGGIAKGYIGDRMRSALLAEKAEHALINLGGNIVCIGGHPSGRPFTVGIQKPFAADATPAASVQLTDKSAVTSGTYQRYIEVDGRRYHHLLDPATGWPKDTGLSGVTIFTDSSADADALSTIVFLMGENEGLAFLKSIGNTQALLIREDGSIISTEDLSYRVP